ncbi:MAG: T9SS type A sorting domain-containing protein [Sporocytophaga sp.]|uniref:T9SS type A sorting domain-containing protein n=1 Tax=Sporocytophaga sp. TaxID=2231183 RepID=UPI001B042BF9|nr:T9SS type A sorting domain-containing protein [Sporocytophaga sp.]MBO9702624.1 T9SS type A sorting domain-containing protein [Sporocytophaga sp.]
MNKSVQKLLLLSIALVIFLGQLSHAGSINTLGVFSPNTRKKSKRSLARIAESKLWLPETEAYYYWDYVTNDWGISPDISKNIYDEKGNLLMNVSFSNAGDSIYKEVHKYNTDGKEIEITSYYWGEEDFIPEYRQYSTYDSYGRPLGYISQVYLLSKNDWENELKVESTYSSIELQSPDNYIQSSWDGEKWKVISKGANIVWKDFENGDIASGFVYKYGIDTLMTIYSTDGGITTGMIWRYEYDVFIPMAKTLSSVDELGNTITVLQVLMNNEYHDYQKTTDLVDDYGNYAGSEIAFWNGSWEISQYNIYNNTYNESGDLVESEIVSYNLDGKGNTEKVKVVYSDFLVITGLQRSENSMSRFAYPNPTTGVVNIEVGGDEVLFSVYNLQNQLILSSSTSGGKATILMEALPSGVYLLKSVSSSGKLYTEKLVKE